MSINIKKIEFDNFRQYGTGEMSFHEGNDCKLSLVVAQNGTGKTTLLNAITWCLYGVEKQLLDSDKALSIVNAKKLDNTKEQGAIPVSVAITIDDNEKVIEFKRTQWFHKETNIHGTPIAVPGSVFYKATITEKNKFVNTFVLEDNDAVLLTKQYFDEAIYSYYFFDGEQLKDFFSKEKAPKIKESVFNIAQVTMLSNALEKLEKIRKDKNKTLKQLDPNIEILLEKNEKYNKIIQQAKKNNDNSNILLNELQKQFNEKDALLREYEPIKKMQITRELLLKELNNYEMEKLSYAAERSNFVRKYLVLIRLYPQIKQSLLIIQNKENNGELPPSIDKSQIRRILDNPNDKCPVCNGLIDDDAIAHLTHLWNQLAVSSQTSNYLKEMKGSLEYYIDETKKYYSIKEELLIKENKINSKIEELEDKLKKINATFMKYKDSNNEFDVAKIEMERTDLEKQIRLENQNIGANTNTIKTYSKLLEKNEKELAEARKKISGQEEVKKQIDVLDELVDEFKGVKERITDRMRKEIEDITWEYFDSMIWKETTFGKIEVAENYIANVYDKTGAIMTGSLGATEQMALAYAFTLAIHFVSGKNCPLVIDSPLGRVSDENRINMAKALLAVSERKQIIMFFTPDEYSEQVQKVFSKRASIRNIKLSNDESHVEGLD